MYAADGRLLHSLYLTSTARQQGKTAVVRALIGWAMTGYLIPEWTRVLGLAHDRKQARIPYKAVQADLAPLAKRSRGALRLTTYLGIRSDLYGRHREYDVASREARDSERGESNDLVIFDEVRTQRDYDTWAAIEPTTTARPDPLVYAISTAGDDRSILLRSWWERGLRIIDGAEPAHGFGMTWYAAPDDAAPDSPAAILAANPSIAEGRLSIGPVLESFRTLPGAQYRMERLNLWADALDEWLPAGLWPSLYAPQPDDGRVTFGVEASPTWSRASIVCAIETGEGAWIGVVADLRPTRGATLQPTDVVAELGRLAPLWRPEVVAYVSTAAVAPHVTAWAEAATVPAVALTARDIRTASELFRAEIIGRRLTHEESPLLAWQARNARPSKPIEGGDWYVSVRHSAGDVDAIRSAAWAAWALLRPDRDLGSQVFV